VYAAAVVALTDEYLGEKICAAIVFKGTPIGLAELNTFLDDRGASKHARPDVLVPMPSLPTTAVGKVDKKRVVAAIRR
jgi:mycobactin salicyl-AMP ligase